MEQCDMICSIFGSMFRYTFLLFSCIIFFPAFAIQTTKTPKDNTPPSASPMSCKIEARIIKIIPTSKSDTGSICAKHPCRAMVKIIRVYGCGSSVSASLDRGDIVEMKFEYTLHNTSKIFPAMKTHYPGMKKGDVFIADAQQHLKMGGGVDFVIASYIKK